MFFDNNQLNVRSHQDGFNGVKTHENGLFLYKSEQADHIVRSRMMDFFLFFGGCAWITGIEPIFFLPILVFMLSYPRKITTLYYYTFHAELLPHSEQVVFHKASFFGKVRRIIVDVKNLEKIEPEAVHGKI